MNWLLIVILLLIVGNIVWGYKQGFMKVALSLVSWVIVLIACYVATPIVADVIIDNTPLAETIQETVSEKLNEVVDEVVGGVANAVDNEAIAKIEEKLPEQVKEAILGEHASVKDLITNTGDVEVDTGELANNAAYIIALVIVLIITRIGLIVVEKVLGLVSMLPIIGQADTLLGIAAGAVKGLVWSWVVLTVIAMLAYTGTNTDLLALVNESKILTWLYENNLIMNVLSEVL